jgi:hypothetical protein
MTITPDMYLLQHSCFDQDKKSDHYYRYDGEEEDPEG